MLWSHMRPVVVPPRLASALCVCASLYPPGSLCGARTAAELPYPADASPHAA